MTYRYQQKQSKYYIAAFGRGWHFADSCMLRGKTPTETELQKMQESATEYAQGQATAHYEDFSKKVAEGAFRNAFNDYPNIL